MNQWIILTFLLAFILGYKYCSTDLKNPFLLVFAVFILYTVYVKAKETTQEDFSSGESAEDDSRVVRYGDIITLWSPSVNKFLQADPTIGNKMTKTPMGKINLSNSLLSSEDIPSSMNWVQYMILDASDPGDVGNTGEILHGSKVYLRTVHYQDGKYLPTYVSPNIDNSVYMSPDRYTENSNRIEQQIKIESGKGLQSSKIRYGDVILLKSWRTDLPYIHVSVTNDVILSNSTASTRNFYVCDRFGQGLYIDWARRGTANQSSTSNNLNAQFAIDGNLLTFSSTAKEEKPSWEVILPKDVMINKIIINNINDPSQTQLSNFIVKLLDNDNTTIDTKKYDDKVNSTYLWESINQISRKVRIELQKSDNLNIANVRVYGQGVNYSLLLNEEMSKNVIQTKDLTTTGSVVVKDRMLPLVTNDMTVMMLLDVNKLPSEVSNIFIKSKNIKENRTPNLLLLPPKKNTNFSTLQYIVTTEGGNNETGENFLVDYNVMPNKKFHFTAVHNAGVNKFNGWVPCTFSSTTDSIDSGTYVCNFNTREVYKIVLQDSVEFKSTTPVKLGDPNIYGFELKGQYSDELSISTIKIYINGMFNTSYEVKSIVKQNADPLTIGKFQKLPGFDGEVSYFKYSNRAIPEDYIQRESHLLIGKLSILLIKEPTRVSTQNLIKMEPNYLPDINSKKPEYTIHFWMNSQRPITGTGNDEPMVTYGDEGLFFYSDKNTFYTKTNTGVVGIEDSKYNIPVDQWIHIAYVIKNNNVALFVNGKQTASNAIAGKDIKTNSFAVITVGGFNGFVGNVYFANYGLSQSELKSYIVSSPINDIFEKVRSEFTKNGCIVDPIDITNPYIDNYNSSWISFASKDDASKLSQSVSDFKKLADDGIETEDVIKLKLAEKCYGKEDADLRVQLNRSRKRLTAAENAKDSLKCLPKAPFTCRSIDDFDIRTHKDFSQYIEKSKIREAPKPVDRVTQLPPDPTKYINRDLVAQNFVEKTKVEESQAFLDMKKKLENTQKQIAEMNKLKDLVTKCQANDEKLANMQKYIDDLKNISGANPQNQAINTQLDKLTAEMATTQSDAAKDAKKLIQKLTINDMIAAKDKIDKEFEDLDKSNNKNLKKNIELDLLNKNLTGSDTPSLQSLKNTVADTISGLDKTISGLDKTNRLLPGLQSMNDTCGTSQTSKIAKYGWLQSKILDLEKIDKIVKDDLKDIQDKLSNYNKKIAKSNMSNSEAAILQNNISSIQQNQLGTISK
jgi:hypothetical protein